MNDMKSFLPFLSTTGRVDISIPQVGYDYPNVIRKHEKQTEKEKKKIFQSRSKSRSG
jgi:type IV secretory pathway ATPase VirB11/archaellum biosynthesis ATPase